jgi:hypothetical protein
MRLGKHCEARVNKKKKQTLQFTGRPVGPYRTISQQLSLKQATHSLHAAEGASGTEIIREATLQEVSFVPVQTRSCGKSPNSTTHSSQPSLSRVSL